MVGPIAHRANAAAVAAPILRYLNVALTRSSPVSAPGWRKNITDPAHPRSCRRHRPGRGRPIGPPSPPPPGLLCPVSLRASVDPGATVPGRARRPSPSAMTRVPVTASSQAERPVNGSRGLPALALAVSSVTNVASPEAEPASSPAGELPAEPSVGSASSDGTPSAASTLPESPVDGRSDPSVDPPVDWLTVPAPAPPSSPSLAMRAGEVTTSAPTCAAPVDPVVVCDPSLVPLSPAVLLPSLRTRTGAWASVAATWAVAVERSADWSPAVVPSLPLPAVLLPSLRTQIGAPIMSAPIWTVPSDLSVEGDPPLGRGPALPDGRASSPSLTTRTGASTVTPPT